MINLITYPFYFKLLQRALITRKSKMTLAYRLKKCHFIGREFRSYNCVIENKEMLDARYIYSAHVP